MKTKIAILVVWLVATAWFIRFEAFPDSFTHSLRGYRDIFPSGVIVRDTWMRVLFKGTPVGYIHTKVDTDEKVLSARYRVENEVKLNIQLMGVREMATVQTEAVLDALYQLQSFSMNVFSRHSTLKVTGRRRDGNVFSVKTDAGGGIVRSNVRIPDETIFYSPGTDLAIARMAPGETMSFKTIDLLSMTPSTVTIRALPRESIVFRGGATNVAVLAAEYLGTSVRSWIDEDGTLLRQETLLKDVVAEASDPEEALGAVDHGIAADDLLQEMAVTPSVRITDPEKCKRLRLRIGGITAAANALESGRQSVELREQGIVQMTIDAARLPSPGTAGKEVPAGLRQHMEPSACIQSDHPEIRKLAADLTARGTNDVEKAAAICKWVFEMIEKRPEPGVPSAIQVLRNRSGDCNEHTYLFVALARAAGLPAKVKVGLVYSETYAAFCYHAWPAVYAGEWLEMDPTFGQTAVDATHFALLEGEFAEQLGLAQMMGKLDITVLAQEY